MNITQIDISTRTLLKIVLLGALILALVKLYNVVLIILIAIVIASFVESAVKKLKPYIKSRSVAVFLIYVVVIGVLVLLSSFYAYLYRRNVGTCIFP